TTPRLGPKRGRRARRGGLWLRATKSAPGGLRHREDHERDDDAEVLDVRGGREEAGHAEQGGDPRRERKAAPQQPRRCRRGDEEPRVDGEPDEEPGCEPPRPLAALDERERPEQQEARERERLHDREVAEDERRERVERERAGGERAAPVAPQDVEVEDGPGRRGEERRQDAHGVPRLARDRDPAAVDVRKERHLLVEEIAIRDVSVAGEAGSGRVDALVSVHEPERDERPEEERLGADREDVGALQDRLRAGTAPCTASAGRPQRPIASSATIARSTPS